MKQQNLCIKMIGYGMKNLGSYPKSGNNYILASRYVSASWNLSNRLPIGKGDLYIFESGKRDESVKLKRNLDCEKL
jgi:hypothetical protein